METSEKSDSSKQDKRRILLEAKLDDIRLKIAKNKKNTIRNIVISLIAGFGYSISILSVFFDFNFETSGFWVYSILLGFILSFFIFFLIGLSWRIQEEKIMADLGEIGTEKLQENLQEDFFNNLVKINFKYIDKYYQQTQIQANKSFTISVVAAIVAFAIIIAGIVLMYKDKVSSAYIATGAGVLSEFIAAVFFYLYNQTIIKMGEYHQKLVLTQNISLALKITEQMKESEKDKAQTFLIEQLTKDINKYLALKPEK